MNFGNAINGYRISRWFYLHKMSFLAKIVRGGYIYYTIPIYRIPQKSEKEQHLDIRE